MGTTRDPVTGQAIDDGAGRVNPLHQAGEEQPASATLSIQRTTDDWKRFRLATGTGEQLVFAGPCRFGGLIVDNGVTSGAVTVRDANATGGSNTAFVLAGSNTDVMRGARMVNGITAQAATTGAGVTILYREAAFS